MQIWECSQLCVTDGNAVVIETCVVGLSVEHFFVMIELMVFFGPAR